MNDGSQESAGRRRGLGRGLSALLGEERAAPEEAESGLRRLPVDRLHPGRFQPRRKFDEAEMAALVESVAAQGILQPLLVRRHPSLPDAFEILAGERRWRAAQRAGLHEVPALLREMGDREALEVALVENVQRQDLAPLEEATGYQRLIQEFGHTQEALGRSLGKSRSHIANMLRLLSLPEGVRVLLETGALSAGHARALLSAKDPVALAKLAVQANYSVREVERLVQGEERAAAAPPIRAPRDPNIAALERELAARLGLAVRIESRDGQRGSLTLQFRTLDQLSDVLARLRGAAG